MIDDELRTATRAFKKWREAEDMWEHPAVRLNVSERLALRALDRAIASEFKTPECKATLNRTADGFDFLASHTGK
jgi:hypothetical protein